MMPRPTRRDLLVVIGRLQALVGAPDIYKNGPTDEMYARLDAEIEKYGGPLPWTGEYPGRDACREFGLWCYWGNPQTREALPTPFTPGGQWLECKAEHPSATEDLNRLLQVAHWDKRLRKWVRR